MVNEVKIRENKLNMKSWNIATGNLRKPQKVWMGLVSQYQTPEDKFAQWIFDIAVV